MDFPSAVKELGLPESGFSRESAERAYRARKEEVTVYRDRAPTADVRAKMDGRLQRLDEAWDFLQDIAWSGQGTSAPSVSPSARVFIYLDRYENRGTLQAGATSDLLHGWDRQRNEEVVLRVWRGQVAEAQTVARSASRWLSVIHPAILGIRQFALENDPPVLVMDALAVGGSLLAQSRPLDADSLLGLGLRLTQILEVLDELGLGHGAICPELVASTEEGFRLLPPFGVDPEALRGFCQPDEASSHQDLTSVARVIYFAAVGKRPYVGCPPLNEVDSSFSAALGDLLREAMDGKRQVALKAFKEGLTEGLRIRSVEDSRRDADATREPPATPAVASAKPDRPGAAVMAVPDVQKPSRQAVIVALAVLASLFLVPLALRIGLSDAKPSDPATADTTADVVSDTTPTMVEIPAGCFQMGSPDSVGDDDEHPAHEVCLGSFRMDVLEVTEGRYRGGIEPGTHSGDLSVPVTGVSWAEADSFCRNSGGRLPTEAEWEYAARGGTTTTWQWGDDSTVGDAYAWFGGNATGEAVQPVKMKKPNGYGLFDMAGNAWEWTADRYSPDYYESSPKRDPKGPRHGERVFRGGDATSPLSNLRPAARGHGASSLRDKSLGFRCVENG